MKLMKISDNKYNIIDHESKYDEIPYTISDIIPLIKENKLYPLLLDNKNEVLSLYGQSILIIDNEKIIIEIKYFNRDLQEFFDDVAGSIGWSLNVLVFNKEIIALGITPIPKKWFKTMDMGDENMNDKKMIIEN